MSETTADVQLVQADLSVLAVEPDDKIVITSPHRLSRDQLDRIKEQMARTFPARTVLVLDDGMKLGVVRKSDAAEQDGVL